MPHAQTGKANTTAQPEGQSIAPALPEFEKDYQDGENEKTTLAQLGGRAESDHRSGSGDFMGDTGSGVEPAGVAARPAETEVSNETETEIAGSSLPAGSTVRPVASRDTELQSGGRLAVGGNQDSLSLSQSEPAQSVVSTNGKPVFRLLPGGFVSTNEPPKNSLQVPTQKELIASDLKSWKRLKGKPPIPDLHVVNPSGKRKIGRLFRVGYEILRRVPCQDCGKERRLTAGYISASQLIELEYEDYETKAGIIKNILRRNAAAIDGRLHDIRCSGCDSGRAGHLEAVG